MATVGFSVQHPSSTAQLPIRIQIFGEESGTHHFMDVASDRAAARHGCQGTREGVPAGASQLGSSLQDLGRNTVCICQDWTSQCECAGLVEHCKINRG